MSSKISLNEDEDVTYQLNSICDQLENQNATTKLTKSRLETLIANNDQRIHVQPKSGRHSSKHWNNYHEVIYNGEITTFAKCRNCLKLYDTKMGTASLSRHKCANNPNPSTSSPSTSHTVKDISSDITNDASITFEESNLMLVNHTTPITADELSEVNICLLDCAKEIRPISLLDSASMRNLFQQLINIGARHGPVDVSQVVPSSRTVSRYLERIHSDHSY